MLNTPRWSTLTLSKGSMFSNVWPAIRDDFPANAETHIYFYDSEGNIIATVEGQVRERELVYKIEPPLLDDVPRGAQYELKIETEDGPYLFEYGAVARREAEFYNPGAALVQPNEARLFIDKFNRNSVGKKWKPIWGQPAMHAMGGDRWGMASNIGLLYAESAVRYFRPLGGDSFRVKFNIYAIPGSAIGIGGSGKIQALFGMDITSHVGFGFEVEHGLVNRKVSTGIVTAPTDLDKIETINKTVNQTSSFIVDYSDLDRIYRIFDGADPLNPIMTWEDTDRELPRGKGFRYFGFAWDSSLTATGPLLTGVEIQDRV
jgi:hypothetical protein